MFRPASSKVSFPDLETSVIQFWKAHRIFQKSLELRRGAKQFTLYEGPPTANGSPGIHHVLSRAFKDIIPRYRTMKGYYTPRKGGWDTHGLPVELEIEKMLGFTSKAQIEDYGIARFNALCRESVFNYLKELPKGECILHLDSSTDIIKAKESVGNYMCVMGNVSFLKLATEEDVKVYCKDLINRVGEKGGFILSSDNPIVMDEEPIEKVKAIIDAKKT